MAQKKLPLEVTTAGTAAYAYLYKRDTQYIKPGEEGKFKLTLVVPKDELKGLTARIEGGSKAIGGEEWIAHLLDMHDKAGGVPANSPVKDGDKPVDKHGKPKEIKEEFRGCYLINTKSAYPAELVDTQKNELPSDVKIMSGDYVKISYRPNVFDGGVNLYLSAVMLVDKRAQSGGSGAFGDDEEGYVADAARSPFAGDDSADSAAGASNGDY